MPKLQRSGEPDFGHSEDMIRHYWHPGYGHVATRSQRSGSFTLISVVADFLPQEPTAKPKRRKRAAAEPGKARRQA
jgi:hypothetical protein